jgi:hypothetical protein
MSTNQAKRPRFFEGQYLGAADMTAALEYGRIQAARHSLGSHTWGIATGLKLKEVESASGGEEGEVDVWITPGLAWDGFGRTIMVLEPKLLPQEKFKGFSAEKKDGYLVEVWLRYDESATAGPRPGFEVCDVEDQHSRVSEGFVIEIGRRERHIDRHDRISVAGEEVDAEEVLRNLYPDEAQIFDESVPYQSFPEEDGEAKWLIPLGYVRWIPNSDPYKLGYFKALDEEEKGEVSSSLRLRKNVGVVAGAVHPVDGIIRMKKRTDDPQLSPWSEDLVWVEGDLRVDEDVKLFGGKIDFRFDDGDQQDVPLLVQRNENGFGGKDLQIVIGKNEDGINRLAVGPEIVDESQDPPTRDFKDKFVILDSGNAGIGVPDPKKLLHLFANSEPALKIESGDSATKSGTILFRQSQDTGVDVYYDDSDGRKGLAVESILAGDPQGVKLFVKNNGNVGVGTTAPGAKLEIASPSSGVALKVGRYEGQPSIKGFGDWLIMDAPDGGRLGINHFVAGDVIIANGGGNVGIGTESPDRQLHIKESTSSSSNGLRIENEGNTRNLRLWVGPGGAVVDAFSGANLHLRTNGNDRLFIRNSTGNVGIGTTNPDRQLHVKELTSNSTNGLRIENAGNTRNLRLWVGPGGAVVDAFSGADLHLRTDDNDRLFIRNTTGNVGIGATNPAEKLDVRGNIKLGSGGNLWAMGAAQNLRVVVGTVASTGSGMGTGYSYSHPDDGHYSVAFTPAFTGTPVVLATALNALANDNVVTVRNMDSSGFVVRTIDVAGAAEGKYQNNAFTFIALGAP